MSPVETFLRAIAKLPAAPAALEAILAEMPVHELAALVYDWPFWARPTQLVDQGAWRSWGFLTGRGWGKTQSSVSFAIDEVEAGRADRLALVAQSEAKTIEILVEGETGILALTPPWLGAEYEPSSNRIVFGNGAQAFVYTPQEPAGLRGPQHQLAIATEIAAWPKATASEAFSNLQLGLRLGYGKLLWDSTPRRRNPIVRELLARAEKHPTRHVVRRGATSENAINLSPGALADWYAEWGGTVRGAEELEGHFFDEGDDALFKRSWIDKARRSWPATLKRRILSIDPAITSNPKYSDATGILDMGLGVDAQLYVLGNHSGVHRAEVWPGLVIDLYVRGHCDVICIETNRGGSAWVALLRGAASARGLQLIELGPLEQPGVRTGVVYVRTFNSRGTKAVRASAAAALTERGRVSFVAGELGDLEERLCAFDGGEGAADDDVDAFVAGCHELAALGGDIRDPREAFRGLRELGRALHRSQSGDPRSKFANEVSQRFARRRDAV